MAVWMVRAGPNGEDEETAIDRSVAIIRYMAVGDLSGVRSREDVRALVDQAYPNANENAKIAWTAQLWSFAGVMKPGDLVVLPFKRRAAIAVGEVTGPYQYRQDLGPTPRHTRPVKWLRSDIPRSIVDQDLLNSLRALMTVCQLRRSDAEARLRALVEEEPVSLPGRPPEGEGPALLDLEAYARDSIREHIGQRFRGPDLERLIRAILQAHGYRTLEAPPGPDGGADIVAGRGPMGFDPPRLLVQVKSGYQPQDVKVLRELQGVMQNFRADRGLLVSWGGFRSSTLSEARKLFFDIRLWDSDDVIDAILECYEDLPEDIQAELPLKRIWTVVPEDREG